MHHKSRMALPEGHTMKHYKKQLIYRQNDQSDPKLPDPYQYSAERSPEKPQLRKKRKHKNCRGQFRHEALELIKLGTTPSTSLCKNPDVRKPAPMPPAPPRFPYMYHPMYPIGHPNLMYPPNPQPYFSPYLAPPFPITNPISNPVLPPIAPNQNPPMIQQPIAVKAPVAGDLKCRHNEDAIDLTVDSRTNKRHKCQCSCGKSCHSTPANTEIMNMVKNNFFNYLITNKTPKNDDNRGVAPRGSMPPLRLISEVIAKGELPKTDLNRRQSVDIDAISVSSGGSSRGSPRTAANQTGKVLPQGKLCYVRERNVFVRYHMDRQKRLFLEGVNGGASEPENSEEIALPVGTNFSLKASLTVDEYVREMIAVEALIPKDFFLFYKFVTGYQICRNNLPVSFLTFLNLYNTDGLTDLLDKYVKTK